MKQYLFFLLLSLISIRLYAQIIPAQSDSALLRQNKVKTLSVYFAQPEDKNETKEFLLLKKEFDTHGKLIKKFMLYLWDAVSYSYTTTYKYNSKNQLAEELRIQKILNLFERDDHFITSFGKEPLNEKIMFFYNDEGRLSKKVIYTFSSEAFPEEIEPIQIIKYEYEDGALVSEISTSPDDCPCNKNYEMHYTYDSLGQLSDKTKLYGKDLNLQQTTHYIYDADGNLLEEIITDSDLPHNNAHYRYAYDSTGRLAGRYLYSAEEEDFVLESDYFYDKDGNLIPGNRDARFEYYENGLIKEESWIDSKTGQRVTFRTIYEFY